MSSMSIKTYTYVYNYGNKILSRGYDQDGRRYNNSDNYSPTLFTRSSTRKATSWHDLNGQPVYDIQPGSIRDCRDFIEQYKDVDNFEVMGMTNWVTQYISDEYPGEIMLNMARTQVNVIDIETTVTEGFPNLETANEEILLITNYNSIHDRYVVYTARACDRSAVDTYLVDNGIDPKKVVISQHADEYHLLKTFVVDWATSYPDIVTGWNSNLFDVVYLVRRIMRILGEDFAKKLSPWGIIKERTVKMNNDELPAIDLIGINLLDYIDLMKKYTYGGRDSWKLDNVADDELGKNKLPFDGSFMDHYTTAWDHFVAYNIIDVGLVKMLDDKMKLIELALTVAYASKIVPDEVFSQIASWDSLIYNYLKEQNIVIPNKKNNARSQFEGAYVKDPIIGKHKWVVSFDLQSLYPHLMMWANISPETMVSQATKNVNVEGLLIKKYDLSSLVEDKLCMTANGVCYTNQQRGFIPKLMDKFYSDRSTIKKQMLKAEQEYANTKSEKWVPEISRLNNKQLAIKIMINSVYGAMGSPYFRYYDLRMAEGITTSGQLAIRWVSADVNAFLNKALGTEGYDYVVYNDTDSAYFRLDKVVEHAGKQDLPHNDIVVFLDKFCEKVLQPTINKSYDRLKDYMNAYEQRLIMKREVIADVAVFVAKKRYAMSVHNSEGVQYKEPKIKVTGLELVRSSTPRVVRDVLKAGVKEVLYGNEASVQKFIADFKTKYMQYSIEEISFPRGVNGVKKYAGSPIYKKGCPINARAALLYNYHVNRLKLDGTMPMIKDGSKIKYIYLRMPNPIHEDVIGYIDKLPKEFTLDTYVDKERMFESSFVSAMQTMLGAIGWEAEPKSTLNDFFF